MSDIRDYKILIHGRWTILRQSRLTGEMLEPLEGPNTVSTAGKNIFLDMMFGTNSPAATDQYDNGSTVLKIYDTGDSEVSVSPVACKSGYPDAVDGSHSVDYWFEDISAAVYDADDLDILNSDSAIVFSTKDATGWSKPASENWIYKYTLSISRGHVDLDYAGLDLGMKVFTGEANISGNEFGAACEIYVEANGGSPNTTVQNTGNGSRTGQTVTQVFVSPVGSHLIEWYDVSVRTPSTHEGGDVVLNKTTEDFDPSTKPSNVERVYTFTFSV